MGIILRLISKTWLERLDSLDIPDWAAFGAFQVVALIGELRLGEGTHAAIKEGDERLAVPS